MFQHHPCHIFIMSDICCKNTTFCFTQFPTNNFNIYYFALKEILVLISTISRTDYLLFRCMAPKNEKA